MKKIEAVCTDRIPVDGQSTALCAPVRRIKRNINDKKLNLKRMLICLLKLNDISKTAEQLCAIMEKVLGVSNIV